MLLTTWFYFCFTLFFPQIIIGRKRYFHWCFNMQFFISKVYTFTYVCFKTVIFLLCYLFILFSNFCKVVGAILFPMYFLPIRCVSTAFTQEAQAPSWWLHWAQFMRKGAPPLSPPSWRLWAEYKYVLASYHVHIFSTLFTHTTWLLAGLEHPTISESEDPMSLEGWQTQTIL